MIHILAQICLVNPLTSLTIYIFSMMNILTTSHSHHAELYLILCKMPQLWTLVLEEEAGS